MSKCGVCSCDINPNEVQVYCKKCLTPHHVDCWVYNKKKCSVMGCDCTTSVDGNQNENYLVLKEYTPGQKISAFMNYYLVTMPYNIFSWLIQSMIFLIKFFFVSLFLPIENQINFINKFNFDKENIEFLTQTKFGIELLFWGVFSTKLWGRLGYLKKEKLTWIGFILFIICVFSFYVLRLVSTKFLHNESYEKQRGNYKIELSNCFFILYGPIYQPIIALIAVLHLIQQEVSNFVFDVYNFVLDNGEKILVNQDQQILSLPNSSSELKKGKQEKDCCG